MSGTLTPENFDRIWLEPREGADIYVGRQWCQDNQWGEDGIEYIRADLPPAPQHNAMGGDLADYVDKATAWDQCCKSSQRARQKALEEAAVVAETGEFYGQFQTAGDERRAKDIAVRIRAIASAEGSEG
jgi:hypothetical protein